MACENKCCPSLWEGQILFAFILSDGLQDFPHMRVLYSSILETFYKSLGFSLCAASFLLVLYTVNFCCLGFPGFSFISTQSAGFCLSLPSVQQVEAGIIVELPFFLFVSCVSRITILHCLITRVLKTIISCILSV